MTASALATPVVVALADDLSGAAEVAAALVCPATASAASQVYLEFPPTGAAAAVQVVDLDCRDLASDEVTRRVSDALLHTARSAQVLLKIDSQLRGNVDACVQAVLAGGRLPVLAPALPAAGRTVVAGALRVHGRRLAETATWRAENKPAPDLVADVLSAPVVNLVDVFAGQELPAGAAVVVDASTDADLDAVVHAFLHRPDVVLIGSAGLGSAVGRAIGPLPTFAPSRPHAQRILVVVGTAEPVARRQVELLVEPGDVTVLELGVSPETVRTALSRGTTVLRAAPLLGRRDPGTASALAELTADVADPDTALVLLGGETARRTCEALGIDVLVPLRQVQHGAVVCTTPDGRVVVVRPGSFGDEDGLLDILRAVHEVAPESLRREALT